MANRTWNDEVNRMREEAKVKNELTREYEAARDERLAAGPIIPEQVFTGDTIPQQAEKGNLSAMRDMAGGYSGREPHPDTGAYEFVTETPAQAAGDSPVKPLDPEGEDRRFEDSNRVNQDADSGLLETKGTLDEGEEPETLGDQGTEPRPSEDEDE